jgi:hypothetical protein
MVYFEHAKRLIDMKYEYYSYFIIDNNNNMTIWNVL